MTVPPPPGLPQVQFEDDPQVLVSPPLNPDVLGPPPGLPWIPGQLLQAAVSGPPYLYYNSPALLDAAWISSDADTVGLAAYSDATSDDLASMTMSAAAWINSDAETVCLAASSDAMSDDLASMTMSKPEISQCEDLTDLEAAFKPVLRSERAKSHLPEKSKTGNGKGSRWWACLELLCPLTGFPICLLPYPPLKVGTDGRRSSNTRLVDGKFLAMRMIATGCHAVCGQELQPSEVGLIDDYIRQCKLGPHRPGRAAALQQEAREATDPARQARARQDLDGMVVLAKADLGKLWRIQEKRLVRISKMLPARFQAAFKNMRKTLFSETISTSPAVSSKGSPTCKY